MLLYNINFETQFKYPTSPGLSFKSLLTFLDKLVQLFCSTVYQNVSSMMKIWRLFNLGILFLEHYSTIKESSLMIDFNNPFYRNSLTWRKIMAIFRNNFFTTITSHTTSSLYLVLSGFCHLILPQHCWQKWYVKCADVKLFMAFLYNPATLTASTPDLRRFILI